MASDLVIATAFLLLLGLTVLNGRHARAGIGEMPLVYESVVVRFFLNLSMLGFFGLAIFLLFFYSWKLFLLLLGIGFLTEALVIVPFLERVLYLLLAPIERRTGSPPIKNTPTMSPAEPVRPSSTLAQTPSAQWTNQEIVAEPDLYKELVLVEGLEQDLPGS